MPIGMELDGGDTLAEDEVIVVFPVPRGTELEPVGMYATRELDDGGEDSDNELELDGGAAMICELEDVGATTTSDPDPVPKGTETDAGDE